MRDFGSAKASVPARICLAGESLDWMIGGPSVVAAIDLRTKVTATVDRRSRVIDLTAHSPLNLRRSIPVADAALLADDPLDYLQACAARVVSTRFGGKLVSRTTAPVGAGVSSSAAVTVAASAALLTAIEGTVPARSRVAQLAFDAERSVGSGAGWMDFLACAYGGLRTIGASSPPTMSLLAPTLGMPVLLIDTLQRRTTTRVLVGKRERFAAGESRIVSYRKHTPPLVDAVAKTLSASTVDYVDLGSLITLAHELLSRLMDCSTPLIDKCVAACLGAGAYGAKLTGSGHGGCLFALVPQDRIPSVVDAVKALPVAHVVLTDTDSRGVDCTLLT